MLQPKASASNFSFRRASSGGSISSTQSEYFNRRTSKNDFERIFLQWCTTCEMEGYSLPKSVVTEFKKRIGQAGKLGEKAKLNLSFASLDDRRLVGLIECLAQKPLIAKLDLRGNDFTDEGVKVIVKLLKGQLRLVKEIEKDKRLTVSFLGEVSLENNSKPLDPKLLKKIGHMCDALRYVNAHAFIRAKYLESHAPEVILSPFLIKMWFDVVGKLDHDRISKAFANANISERSTLGYEELEKILCQGLMLRGALPGLTEETFKNIRIEKSSRQLNAVEDEEHERLVRELNSIPTHIKSQEDYELELQRRAEPPSPDPYGGTSEAVEENKSNNNHSDPVESTETDRVEEEDAVVASLTVTPFSPPSPQFIPSSELIKSLPQIEEDTKEEESLREEVQRQRSESAAANHHPKEEEQEEIQDKSSSLIQIELARSASDFTIPRVDTASYSTSMDGDDKAPTRAKKRRSGDSTHRLSDLFDEIDEVFVETVESNGENHHNKATSMKDRSSSGGGDNPSQSKGQKKQKKKKSNGLEEVEEQEMDQKAQEDVTETNLSSQNLPSTSSEPKPPIDAISQFISLPRKGSNLYEDTVLDLANRNLHFVRFSEFLSPNRFRMLKVLILRNNCISNLSSLQLFQLLPNVTDLDLAYNDLKHRILDVDLPRHIQRLDLSHNQLSDITGIMSCVELRELNLSFNHIKALYGLPVKLTRVDISENRIHTVASLRSLSICFSMVSITVKNNPVMQQLHNVKVFLRSVIPNLQEIDGMKVGSASFLERKKSTESLSPKTGKSKGGLFSSASPYSPSQTTSPKPTKEEQKMQDSLRASQVLARQKLGAASKPLLEEYAVSDLTQQKAKRMKPDEIDSLTKRLYAPRGSPNDPRKYATKVTPGKKTRRRHSGDNKNGAVDSSALVDEWLGNASRQFDRIVKAFRTAKSFIRLERVQEKELDSFNAILDEIQACQLVDINILLKPCLDQKYKEHDKIADIPKMHHDLEKSVLILYQIQTILLFCCDGAINLVDGMDLIMGSKAGQYVNDHVLKLYNCYYEINYNYQDFVTRQASTRSISTEGFTYDVRDEFMADNPMVDIESRRRSSMITILSHSNDSSNPLHRVRNRVMNKYLPPEIKLDLGLENNELQFAEHNPMKTKKTSLSPLKAVKEEETQADSAKNNEAKTENEDPVSLPSNQTMPEQEKNEEELAKEPVALVTPETVAKDSSAHSTSTEKRSPAHTSASPIKSPSQSPSLKPTSSFKRSIDKITQKLSQKDLKSAGQQEKNKEKDVSSAKERLRKRLDLNKSKSNIPEVEEAASIKEIADNSQLVTEADDNPPEGVESTAISQIQSTKSPLKVQTDVVVVKSPRASPRSGGKKSPVTSPRASSPKGTTSSPRLSSQGSRSSTPNSKSPKVFTFDSDPLSKSQSFNSTPTNSADAAKLNAKERLRLRMEKNKKNA